MRNTYIILGVFAVILLGVFFFKNDRLEAPTDTDVNVNVNNPAGTSEEGAGGGLDTDLNQGANNPVKEFTVIGSNFEFSPSVIKVKQGDRVKITFNNNQGFHDFVVDEYGVATKQTSSPTSEVIEFTAGKKGSFEYYCSVGTHRSLGMKGTLIVE